MSIEDKIAVEEHLLSLTAQERKLSQVARLVLQ